MKHRVKSSMNMNRCSISGTEQSSSHVCATSVSGSSGPSRCESLFTADARTLDERLYEVVRSHLGSIGTVFVGMGFEGLSLNRVSGLVLASAASEEMSDSRCATASDREGALAVVQAVGARAAYVYALGLEPWLSHVVGVPPSLAHMFKDMNHRLVAEAERFIATCRERGVQAELLSGMRTLALQRDG
jgi:hypothetical protein